MKRKYVIMEWDDSINPQDQSIDPAEPIDVVSTVERAEEICLAMEAEHPGFIYYWREVISSEG